MSGLFSYLSDVHGIVLNDQQKKAISTQARSTLLLAVPGSGKTTVLTARIAYCLSVLHISPARILTLTFSRETAADMQRRYTALFSAFPQVRFSTIHSFCYRVLHLYAKQYRRRLPTLLAGENAAVKYRILRDAVRKATGRYPAEDQLEEIEQEIGRIKNRMLSPQQSESGIEAFEDIYQTYAAACKEGRFMDFDDMLVLCWDIFRRCPDILNRVQDQYDAVCVDEAQDTSLLQHRIIALLVQKGAMLFMVGDEDQSIYSFRGASPEELLRFSELYHDAAVFKMEANYRSEKEIVVLADRFIAQNQMRYEKHMYCGTDRNAKGAVEIVRLADCCGQYGRIAARLKEGMGKGKQAVLYRNNESAVPLIDLLLREKIAYTCREQEMPFFNSDTVEDVRAYLRLAADPCDIEAFSRLYYKLGCSRLIFLYTKEHIAEYPSVFDCAASFSSLPEYRRNWLLKSRDIFRKLLSMRPANVIDIIRKELGYDRFIERRMNGYTKISAYQKLSALSLIASGLKHPIDLNTRLSVLSEAVRRGGGEEEPVILSTIHSSKGMEFDTVYLLDLYDDVLPSCDAKRQRSEGDVSAYENEVRLFYVAATRAKRRLVLFEGNRLNGEEVEPSPFIRQFTDGRTDKPERSRKRIETLKPQTRVRHASFGDGTVLYVEDDFITISFDLAGCKRLSLPVCEQRRLLVPITLD